MIIALNYAWCKIEIKKNILSSMIHSWWLAVGGRNVGHRPNACCAYLHILSLTAQVLRHVKGPF